MTEVLELAGRALSALAGTVALIEPGHWRQPTPCDQWTVCDLLEHIVAVNRKYERIPAGDPWLPGLADVDLGPDPTRTYSETVGPFLAAWSRPGVLEQLVLTQGDEMVPAERPLRAHLRETVVHGWDLAVAIGQAAPFDDEVIGACLEVVLSLPANQSVGPGYADAVPTLDGVDPIVRLVAFYGRDVQAWS